MAYELVSNNPGWIHKSNTEKIDDSFSEILNFYVFYTPCKETSSKGISLMRRGWPENIWKESILRDNLLEIADLKVGITYCKSKKRGNMSTAINSAGLNGIFHKKRDCNRIAFYHSGKHPEFMDIFYYIRCAFAHGRFERYDCDGKKIYVMESIQKTQEKGTYLVKARMILSETTLIAWAALLRDGEKTLKKLIEKKEQSIIEDIIHEIRTGNNKTEKRIINVLPYSKNEISKTFRKLKSDKIIVYNPRLHSWTFTGIAANTN